MKKLLLILVVHLSGISATTATAQSNLSATNDKLIAFKSSSQPGNSGTTTSSKPTDVNDRALRNFKKNFSGVTDDVWAKTQDGYVVRFSSNGIQTQAFLTNRGHCQGCIRYYSEKELPADIRHLVRSSYYDFTITSVKEVSVNKQTAYLVTIEDKTSWKVLRIVDGEMDVWEEHQKG